MNRIRLLIFDWDGTLADSAGQIVSAMQKAITGLGLPARSDQAIGELIGLGLNEALQRLYPELELNGLRQLLDSYRARWLSEGAGEALLFAGALDALQHLHREGMQIAVATGKSRRGLDRSLAHHVGVGELVLHSRCADETASKPDPRMLVELLAATNLAAHEALMVGDTEYDMAMARAIGMPALGVACGVHESGRLLQSGARAVIDGVHALPDWLAAARLAAAQAQGSG